MQIVGLIIYDGLYCYCCPEYYKIHLLNCEASSLSKAGPYIAHNLKQFGRRLVCVMLVVM